MNTPLPYLGEMLALATALLWAGSVVLFKKSGETTDPVALNLFKNSVAFILLLPTMWLLGTPLLPNLPLSSYLIVALSGVIAMGIADSLFFASLNRIGAGRMAVIEAIYSPSVIFLSFLFLAERLALFQMVGAVVIITAILVATVEKQHNGLSGRSLLLFTLLGVLSNVLMAVGLVMVKPILDAQPLLWVIEWRLAGGIVSLLLLLAVHPKRGQMLGSLRIAGGRRYTLLGSFFGAYLVLITWLGGMKYTSASAASALNQTSTVFTFLLAGIFLHEALNARRWIAIALAVCGALLVTFGAGG